MKQKRIYLDYAATTPVDGRVLTAMMPYFSEKYGNSVSMHQEGNETGVAVERARKVVADFLGANINEVYFTGSATESNNTVLKGVMRANKEKGNHLIISAIEHDCVMNSAKYLKKQGFELTILPVNKFGLVDIEELKAAIKTDTVLVSIMHANNEIGTIQDIGKIGEICRQAGVLFHTDAAQSFGKEKINVVEQKIDLLSASAHKIYGPKGAAILYVRKGIKIEPLLHGGGHESGMRSSTVNVPAVVGMAGAVEIYKKEGNTENARLVKMRDRLIESILKNIEHTSLNGDKVRRLASNVNISFDFIEGESLMLALDDLGLAVSTGSACSSNSLDPSHVIMAIGAGVEAAHGSIRFSLGRETQEADVDYLLEVLPGAVERLRSISPFKSLSPTDSSL